MFCGHPNKILPKETTNKVLIREITPFGLFFNFEKCSEEHRSIAVALDGNMQYCIEHNGLDGLLAVTLFVLDPPLCDIFSLSIRGSVT